MRLNEVAAQHNDQVYRVSVRMVGTNHNNVEQTLWNVLKQLNVPVDEVYTVNPTDTTIVVAVLDQTMDYAFDQQAIESELQHAFADKEGLKVTIERNSDF